MRPSPAYRPTPRARRAPRILSLVLCALPALAQDPPAWSIHDIDGDGYLSSEEYGVLLELRRGRHARHRGIAPQPAPAFAEVDRNGDGLIDEDELTDALEQSMYRYRHRGPPWR
jgi:hypothetical protein